ncbi:MAG: HD domain-containing protein [Lachnospiraceae bacterium]|nr:HD domain-containing protein [Lachnospiraceae bacterium]
MKHIAEINESDHIREIYLCKGVSSAVTKNGKEYLNVQLMDRTGTIDGKIWEPGDAGIDDFSKHDYVEVNADVNVWNNAKQLNIKRVRVAREGEYDPAEYLPVSPRDNEEMYKELLGFIDSVKDPHYNALLKKLFVEDEDLSRKFRTCSAAKTVHHGFVGGLIQHTLGVAGVCDYISGKYEVLNRDLLITAALCHDIAKTKEFTAFPENDYSDDGQLLGHIVMGSEMVAIAASQIEGFPHTHLSQLQHCILAHHGKYEFGSPKLPALVEAMALNLADEMDSKIEIFTELFENSADKKGQWLGTKKFLNDANVRSTIM